MGSHQADRETRSEPFGCDAGDGRRNHRCYPDRAAAAVGRLTGLAYTLAHEEVRARVASITAESYAMGKRLLREITAKEDLPMPAGQFVRVLHALTEGLVFQRLLTPELLPDQVIRAAFLALATKRH